MGYVPRPCPNMARKYDIFSLKVVCMVSIESSWFLDCRYIIIKTFEFIPKITELWAKNECPFMDAPTIFDYNSALK